MKKIILLLLMVFSSSAFCVSPFWLGAGSLTHNFGSAQNDEKGGTKKFQFAPTILAGMTIPFLYSDLFLSPGIGYARFSSEDNTSRNEIILQYHANQQLASIFLLRFGFSNYITKIGGKGGTVTLNNGNSTATFYVPKESKTTYTASLDIGGEFVLGSDFTARAQVSIMRFLSSERRRVSHLLTINYFL